MAKLSKGITGSTMPGLAKALDQADAPMMSLAEALRAYVTAHPGKSAAGGGGGSGAGGGSGGGGHKGTGKDHKSGGGHGLKGHHPVDGGSGANPGGTDLPGAGGSPVYITVNYNGKKPSPEDHQAAMLQLSAAIGVA
jgi:hypothetical protein